MNTTEDTQQRTSVKYSYLAPDRIVGISSAVVNVLKRFTFLVKSLVAIPCTQEVHRNYVIIINTVFCSLSA